MGTMTMGSIDYMWVVVASELRSYRDAIARVIESLRPNVTVRAVEPGDLDREVERLRPGFVICSRVTPAVESSVSTWVELHPDHGSYSRVSVGGETTTVEDMQLDDLITLLDETYGAPREN